MNCLGACPLANPLFFLLSQKDFITYCFLQHGEYFTATKSKKKFKKEGFTAIFFADLYMGGS